MRHFSFLPLKKGCKISCQRHALSRHYTITFIYVLMIFIAINTITFKAQALTPIECTTNFPCQPELKPKIEFWIKVFSQFDQHKAIFHDVDSPEIVYSVIDSNVPCGFGRRNGPIEQERERIRQLIRSLESKQTNPSASYSDEEQALLSQIKGSSTYELDGATERIRCQNGVKDQFEKALSRYRYYKGDVVQVLRQYNLPEDIQYLPFVESSYNPAAYSKVGAAGLWQIMPRTARILGLKIDASIDERLDPLLATKAAGRYFLNSYQVLNSTAEEGHNDQTLLGPFVITSYNYGIGGMRKALEVHGSNFIDVLNNYKGKSFRVAVKNFYASFLAAKQIVTHESEYFQNIEPYIFPPFKTMTVPRSMSALKFSEQFKIPVDTLREMNPMLTKRVWSGVHPIPQNFDLKIPNSVSPDDTSKTLTSIDPDKIEVRVKNYKVQKGDTPCAVAHMFQIGCDELMASNGLTGGRIRVGQNLTIPSHEKPALVAIVDKKPPPTPKLPENIPTQRPATSPALQKSIVIMDETPTQPVAEKIQPVTTPTTKTPESTMVKQITPESKVAESPAAPSVAIESKPSAMPAPAPVTETKSVIPPASNQVAVESPTETTVNGSERFLVSKEIGTSGNYYIYVENEETLGHYSDWIAHVTTQEIRKLNNIAFGKALAVGDKIIIPLKSDEDKQIFEKKRIEYHQTLEEGFDDQFNVIAFTAYEVKKGDNEWTVSNKLQIPMWLLKKYNSTLGQRPMRVGDKLTVPILKEKSENNAVEPAPELVPAPQPN